MRMIAGLSYIAYAVGAGLNMSKLNKQQKQWAIFELTVNTIAGLLPLAEGVGQFNKWLKANLLEPGT